MGYFMVHLKAAQKILDYNDDIKDISAFYAGSLAPDAIMFRQGCKRSDKELTHFCVGDEGWGYYTNYEDWMNSLILNIKKYKGKINDDFLFGYFTHVFTDILYSEQIWTPNRLIKDDIHMDKYLKDCYEIDSLLLESLDNKECMWSLLKNTQKYCLPNILTDGDMTKLINEMTTSMYYNRKPNQSYIFHAITPSDMLEFIEKTIERVNEIYEDLFIK